MRKLTTKMAGHSLVIQRMRYTQSFDEETIVRSLTHHQAPFPGS